MTIAQEEIFGPVLVLIPYDGIDNAVEIANDSPYGLAGAVFAADKETGIAIAKRIRTGQVTVNGGAFNPNAPFGGYKQSGIGREQYWCSTAFQRPRRTHKQCLEKSKDRLSINLTL